MNNGDRGETEIVESKRLDVEVDDEDVAGVVPEDGGGEPP